MLQLWPFRTFEKYFARWIWGSIYDLNGACAGPCGPLAHCRPDLGRAGQILWIAPLAWALRHRWGAGALGIGLTRRVGYFASAGKVPNPTGEANAQCASPPPMAKSPSQRCDP